VHQRSHITQLALAADRAPTVVLTDQPAEVPERVASILRLHDAGKCPTDIGRDLDIPPRNVSRVIRAQGLTPHEGRGKNPPRKAAP
jgi:hypothetical protein